MTGRAEKHRSGVKGVRWFASHACWNVELGPSRAGAKVKVEYFYPESESPQALEDARVVAVQRRSELEAQHLQFTTCPSQFTMDAKAAPNIQALKEVLENEYAVAAAGLKGFGEQ